MHAGPCEDARGASLLGVVKLAAAPELAVPRLDEEVAGRGARPAGEGLGLLDGALLLSMQRPRSVLGMQGPVGASAGCAGAAGGTNVGSTVMQSHSGLCRVLPGRQTTCVLSKAATAARPHEGASHPPWEGPKLLVWLNLTPPCRAPSPAPALPQQPHCNQCACGMAWDNPSAPACCCGSHAGCPGSTALQHCSAG